VTDADGARDAFQHIYDTDHWWGGSGPGSQVDATSPYARVLQAVIGARDVTTVVDAGCGAWEFSRHIDWNPVRYTGIDIVPHVVEANTAAFARPGIEFVCADIRAVALPPADLLVCKDVLQHWDLASIHGFLDRNLSRYRYALITNDVASVHLEDAMLNADIRIGAWRTLDLERAPFSLKARWRHDYDIRGEWTKRCLLFVRRRDLPLAALRSNSAYRICRGL